MQVKRWLHNTVLASTKIGNIMFDPYLTDKYKGDKAKADFIFITHSHYDHFSPKDILHVASKNAKIICPDSLKEKCSALLPVVDALPGLTITVIDAYNLNKPFHKKEDGGVGYVINDGDCSLYVAGDTDLTPEVTAVKCDICALPIGGTYTMDVREAAHCVSLIKPKTVIPTHYGDIDSVAGEEAAELFASLIPKEIKCLIFKAER